MKRKNQRLTGTVALLLIINAILFFSSGTRGTTFEIDRFAVADTAALKQVIIAHKDFNNVLKRDGDVWSLNDTYRVDSYLKKILFAVLSEVAVRRQLSTEESTQLWSEGEDRGYQVQLAGSDDRNFLVIGNSKYTRTYFLEGPSEGYEVEIPGYRDYVGGIFQLTTDQWRDRELFRSSFNSLQSVEIDYNDGPDVVLSYADGFFGVDGVSSLDSGQVVAYIQQFNLLQANEIIGAGKFPRYDSLVTTEPLAVIRASDIAWNRPFALQVYPRLDGERIHLVALLDGTMAVLQASKISGLLARPSDFQVQ